MTVRILPKTQKKINLEIDRWEPDNYSWRIASTDTYTFTITGLNPNKTYQISQNNKITPLTVGKGGNAIIIATCKKPVSFKIQTK
jgi:hypothetical protein